MYFKTTKTTWSISMFYYFIKPKKLIQNYKFKIYNFNSISSSRDCYK